MAPNRPDPMLIARLLEDLQEVIEDDEVLHLATCCEEGRSALFHALIIMAAHILCGDEEQNTTVWYRVTDAADKAREQMMAAWKKGKMEGN